MYYNNYNTEKRRETMRKAKKIIAVFLSLVLFSLTFTAVTASTEISSDKRVNTFEALLNGDFEDGLENWESADEGIASISTDNVYSGEKSLHINTKKATFISQKVPVSVGDNLILQIFGDSVKYSSNTAYAYITFEAYKGDTKIDSKNTNKRISASAGWVELKLEYAVPEGSEYILLKLGTSAGAELYFDKAMLLCIPAVIAYDKVERAALNPTENLVKNPSFEIFNGSLVSDWNVHLAERYGNWGRNKYTNYATDIVRTGTYSVRIQGLDGRYPDITQTISPNLEPLAQYRFDAYVYSTKQVVCDVFIRYIDKNGNVLTSQTNQRSGVTSVNKWCQLTSYFTIEDIEDTYSYEFYIRTNANCDIYVDDLSFFKVEEPKACSIETDQWYYYKEWEGGTANISVSKKIVDENPEGTAKVYMTRKNSNEKLSVQNYAKIEQKFQYSFKTEDLSPEYGDVFYVNAEFYSKEGTLVGSNKEYICYYARPTNLTEDGTWLDNDKNPFKVIIGNAGGSERQVKYAASSGITVVTVGYTRNITSIKNQLDMCEKYGVKALIHLHQDSNACGRYPLDTINIIKTFKDHPATFGYSVQDEPKVVTNPMPGLRISYQLIRDLDPDHPVYFVESCIMQSDDQFKVCDFLCSDAYSADRASYAEYVAPYMIKLKKGSEKNHNKPTEGLIQTFDWRNYFPTVDEARHMIYQVMFAGIDLPGYYELIGICDHPDFADGLVNFNTVELPKVYDLFHSGRCEIIDFDNEEGSELWYYAWKDGKNTYVSAINRNPRAQKQVAIFDFAEPEGVLKTYGNTEGSSLEFKPGNALLTLAPGACVMYEFENETTLKIKSGNEYLPLSPHSDETVTAIYSPKEGEDEGKEPVIILAYYDNTDEVASLFKVSIQKVQKENGVYTATDTVSKDDVPSSYSVKAFVMENNSIKPLIVAEKISGRK